MSSASRTNVIPTAMLKNIYKVAIPGCPFFRRLALSSANVEKVVKPPQIPTFRKRNIRGFKLLDFNARAVTRPITKQPRTFIAKETVLLLESIRSGISKLNRQLHQVQRLNNQSFVFSFF